jgi:hypothetical protein
MTNTEGLATMTTTTPKGAPMGTRSAMRGGCEDGQTRGDCAKTASRRTSGDGGRRAGATTATATAVALALACALPACGGGATAAQGPAAPGGSRDPNKWPADDKSLCDWKNKPELEAAETAGNGAPKPNVRRVYKVIGDRDARRRTLVCREVDTNLDGLKDVVRTYNEKGEPVHEAADTNYDGKLDVWISFVGGRLAEVQVDSNNDGRPDQWKYYNDGRLARIKRDRNFDGRPDVWEVYTRGKLERVGVDETFDGHVDRWDRDQQLVAQQDEEERRASEAAAAAQGGGQGEAPAKEGETKEGGAKPSGK